MDRNAEHIKRQMLVNATEITRLMTRIRQTLADRGNSEQGREAWASACAEFHRRYGELAFPGGYGDAIERILAGEAAAVEAALCFLECRRRNRPRNMLMRAAMWGLIGKTRGHGLTMRSNAVCRFAPGRARRARSGNALRRLVRTA